MDSRPSSSNRSRPRAGPRVLFVSYDGLLDPLGQSQILPYLRGLAAKGAVMTLLSFEKAAARNAPERMQAVQAELRQWGVRWIPLKYHKRCPALATAYDVGIGLLEGRRAIRADHIQLIHARSYVATLIAWLLSRWLRVPFVFATIGFWIDERLDVGFWSPRNPLYHVAKRLEREFFRSASHIVMLTERSRQLVERWFDFRGSRVSVVPTCVDLQRFSGSRVAQPPGHAPVFIYTGSVGTCYLLHEVVECVVQARRRFPQARLVVLTPQEQEAFALAAARLPTESLTVRAVRYAEVPSYLAEAHVGLAFYKPAFARVGTCPTKIGEYLAMGLPVIVNGGVGDVEDLIEPARVGVVVSEFSPQSYAQALERLERLWADPLLPARCRQIAEAHFSLVLGVERYWAAYEQLAALRS